MDDLVTISMIDDRSGVVVTVACHGNPGMVAKTLKTHYGDYHKVSQLVGMGDISCLRKNLESSDFHCRDNGDDWDGVKPSYYQSLEIFAGHFPSLKHNFFFWDGKWWDLKGSGLVEI